MNYLEPVNWFNELYAGVAVCSPVVSVEVSGDVLMTQVSDLMQLT